MNHREPSSRPDAAGGAFGRVAWVGGLLDRQGSVALVSPMWLSRGAQPKEASVSTGARAWAWSVLRGTGIGLLAALLLNACARYKPEVARLLPFPTPVIVASTPTDDVHRLPTVRLTQPAGAMPERVTGQPFAVTVANCAGSTVQETQHIETMVLDSPLSFGPLETLDASYQLRETSDLELMVARLVRRTYGLADGEEIEFSDQVTAAIPGQHRSELLLRWVTVWDSNKAELVDGDRPMAALPVRVLMGAELELLNAASQPCAVSRPLSPLPTPIQAGAGPTTRPPAADQSLALVRAYLDALAWGEYRAAYGLLHDSYQDAHPFDSWSRGYAPIHQIEVHAMESARLDGLTDEVIVGVTLGADVGGVLSYSDWSAVYRVVADRGRPPFQRAIYRISMRPVGVG